MICYRAKWIVPIAGAPLRDSCVAVDGGRIVAVGETDGRETVDLGNVAILPGLVNAHTHLELSYLHRAIPPAAQFTDWIRDVMRMRREHPDPRAPVIIAAAARAMVDMRASGTAVVGDVSNSLVTAPMLADAGMQAVVFYELLGFNAPDPQGVVTRARQALDGLGAHPGVAATLAAHAPYSVSPELFRAIRSDLELRPLRKSTVHLGESPEESELLRSGQGPWRTLLQELGVWSDSWRVPRRTPVEYLDDLGFLDRDVLVVHGVQFTGGDLDRLHALGATLVACPRSNRHVGVGSPPLEVFYARKVRVAFGTDSLASVEDLNLFGELAEARRIAPRVPAHALLESATLVGAQALGLSRDFGSIEPGKRASLIAVRVPERVVDVEEYLVSGIQPDAIQWLS